MKSNILAVVVFLMFFPAKGAYAQNNYYLPHIANGNFGSVSFRTTFILFNNSDAGATAILNLTDDGGNPLTMTIGGLDTGSQFVINLDGGSTGFLQSDGLGSGIVGAVTVTATAASGGGNNTYLSQVNPLTGRYLIVVPDGTYSLSACYRPAGAPNTMAVTVTYSDPNPVQVVFDAVRDITLPSVTLFNASGAVSGLNNLPSGATTIVFTSLDNKVQGRFTLDASGNYQGVLPAGNYLACVGNGSSQIYNLGPLTVGGGPATRNYAIPATAMLSGTISGGGLPSIPSGTVVTATDTSAPRITQRACCTPPASGLRPPAVRASIRWFWHKTGASL